MTDAQEVCPTCGCKPNGDQALVTMKEAARMIGFHYETVRQWVKAGIVPAKRYGSYGILRIRVVDLEAGRIEERRRAIEGAG